MKKIILVGLMLMSANSWASCEAVANVTGLTEVQVQKLKVECEKDRLANTSTTSVPAKINELASVDPTQISQIGAIAKTAGATVREVAAELNIAVNKFIETPVGMLTAALAVWYVAGDSVQGLLSKTWAVVGGIVTMIIMPPVLRRFRARVLLKKESKTVTKQSWIPLMPGREVEEPQYYTWGELGSDTANLVFLLYCAELVIYITGVAIMFG